MLDPTSNRELDEIPVGASPHQPLFTPDGYEALVVAQGPGELDIVDAEDHDVEARVPVGTFPHWTALSSDGAIAFIANEGSNDVSVVDLRTNTVVTTIQVGNAPRKIAVQPGPITASVGGSGHRLAAASVDIEDLPTPDMPTDDVNGVQDDGGQANVAEIAANDYFFAPAVLEGAPGQTPTIAINNASGPLHNFSVGGQADVDIPARGRTTVTVTFPDAGALRFFCKYHSALGMSGQLQAAGAP